MFEEASAAVQATRSEVNIAFALSKLGIAAEYEGDFAGGLRYHLDAHGRFEHVGDPAGVGYAMSRASVDAYALGAFSDALGYSETALEAWRSIDHPWGISYSLARAGLAQARLGSTDEARARMAEAYEAARDGDIEYLMTYATAGLGVVLWLEGDAARAASILGSVFADESFPSLVKRHFDGDRDAIHAELGPARLQRLRRMRRDARRRKSQPRFFRRGDALMDPSPPAGFRDGATGLEPATSGVTGRSDSDDARRRSATNANNHPESAAPRRQLRGSATSPRSEAFGRRLDVRFSFWSGASTVLAAAAVE